MDMKGYNGDVVGMWCGLLLALAFQMSYYVIGDLMGTIEVVLDSTTKRMGLNHDTNIVLHHQTKNPMKHIGLNQKTSHHFPILAVVQLLRVACGEQRASPPRQAPPWIRNGTGRSAESVEGTYQRSSGTWRPGVVPGLPGLGLARNGR